MGEREAYERMRSSIDQAYADAERLVREAESAARGAAGDVPPRGYAAPGREGGRGSPDLQALAGLLDLARSAVPPEIAQQLLDALRQVLLAIRALIDWYLERLDSRGPEPPPVEDIPIS